jgi:hypothetical protein
MGPWHTIVIFKREDVSSGHTYRAPEMQSANARLSASTTESGPLIR